MTDECSICGASYGEEHDKVAHAEAKADEVEVRVSDLESLLEETQEKLKEGVGKMNADIIDELDRVQEFVEPYVKKARKEGAKQLADVLTKFINEDVRVWRSKMYIDSETDMLMFKTENKILSEIKRLKELEK